MTFIYRSAIQNKTRQSGFYSMNLLKEPEYIFGF
jgi:hypothetical protein